MNKIRNSDLLKKFGNHLKTLRSEKGLTQEQLANDADIPINQVGRIERGEVNPTLSTLYSISNALNLALSDLLSGKDF